MTNDRELEQNGGSYEVCAMHEYIAKTLHIEQYKFREWSDPNGGTAALAAAIFFPPGFMLRTLNELFFPSEERVTGGF